MGCRATAAMLVASILVLSGCQGSSSVESSGSRAFTFCLFDLSGTTRTNRSSYSSDFNQVLSGLRGGDTLWVGAITQSSLATGRIPLQLDVPSYSFFSSNDDDYPEQVRSQKNDFESRLDRWVTSQSTPRTTIFDSLLLAQKVFHTDKAQTASHKVLVIFSDMLEDDGTYDFETEEITPEVTRKILEHQSALGRIPDLAGVTIFVAGATANPHTNASRIHQVQRFWQAYFQAAGTPLPDAQYGASLLAFSIPQSTSSEK